jgi:hypothetical protein
MSWSSAFDDPIPLPRGRHLVTLKDAATCIQKLPKAEQNLEEWQAAVEALLLVVELNGPTMMARIGIMRALNRNVERVFDPSQGSSLGKKETETRRVTNSSCPKMRNAA